ncbi:MAG: hypothetical protein AB2L11_00480 [Syntrophobacteraceae bacterium]
MPDKSPFSSPGKIIEVALRLFGGMLAFMGGVCVLFSAIGLLKGDEDSLVALIVGAIMLAIGIAMFKLGKRAATAVDERLFRIRVDTDTGEVESLDEDKEVYKENFEAYGRSVERVTVRRKPVNEKGDPVESYAVQRAYRISDQNRFIVGRNRSLLQFSLGLVLWIVAFFYSNGLDVILSKGALDFDFLSFIPALVGLIFVVIGGLDEHVVIDKAESSVKRDRAWFFLRFTKLCKWHQFDHVLIRRTTSEMLDSNDNAMSGDVEAGYRVSLCGTESLDLIRFDDVFDARALARKVADYTGFVVKEDL